MDAGQRRFRRGVLDDVDITQLILDDHHEQRRLFAILEQIDHTDTAALSAVWARLSAFLDVHAEAEERYFYPELLRIGAGAGGMESPESETEDAIADHNEIRDTAAAVAAYEVGSRDWYQAVAKANEANSDHMAEEEREGLTDFREHADLQLRHDLAVSFAAFEATHFAGVPAVDKDPEGYVREVEQQIEPSGSRGGNGSDGSMGIGGLKGR